LVWAGFYNLKETNSPPPSIRLLYHKNKVATNIAEEGGGKRGYFFLGFKVVCQAKGDRKGEVME